MYVVLDSNIWISEQGLKSTLGAAVCFYLKSNQAVLVLPEVVRLESEKKLRNRLNEYISSIRQGHSSLLSVFGTLKEVVLPTEGEVEALVGDLFENIGVETVEIPFSFESAKSSFFKTIDKLPPSDKSQQFKDGVLWADCIELLKKGDIYFVTADKAFFENRQVSKGLASSLAEELNDSENKLKIFSSLHELISSIKTDTTISQDDLFETLIELHQESIEKLLDRSGFERGDISDSSTSSYATEDPSILFVEYEFLIDCSPTIKDGRKQGELILTGDCQLNLDKGHYEQIRNQDMKFSFISADGSTEETANHFLYANSIVLGHREVKHSVRYKLD